MRALAGGWLPNPRRLFGLGTGLSLATILVPPLTSADILMYAGYGRLQMIGRNPYEITPAEVFRGQFDPVLRWTEQPWQDTPSVYGPITSWLQWLANYLGGENMHDIVFWLQVITVVPFIIACAGIVQLAHGDKRRQARAALLTVCNPVLIWAVVATAHNEALSVMFAVAGIMLMRKSPFGAGLGIGLAGCAKLSIGIWGLAMLWAYRREPKKAALLCLGTIIPMGLAYVVWQPNGVLPGAAQRLVRLGRLLGEPGLPASSTCSWRTGSPRSSSASSPTPVWWSSPGCCRRWCRGPRRRVCRGAPTRGSTR